MRSRNEEKWSGLYTEEVIMENPESSEGKYFYLNLNSFILWELKPAIRHGVKVSSRMGLPNVHAS
jgi:hypothetical protein